MAPVNPTSIPTAADFEVIQNRLAVALAKRERLIKSWTASSSRPRPPAKTQEELDAEDAELFNPVPASLGLGAPIPMEFLEGDVKRKEIWNNDKLRSLIMGRKAGAQASKPRDGKEKAAVSKRVLESESSDDDEGRSALGKAKKSKNGLNSSIITKPLKDGAMGEVKEEAKSTSEQKAISESDLTGRSSVKPQSQPEIRPEVPQSTAHLQRLKVQAPIQQMPLVDYPSDDEGDENDRGSTAAVTSKVISALPRPSINATAESSRGTGIKGESDATVTYKSTSTPIVSAISSKKELAESRIHVLNDGFKLPMKPSSKSGSSHSSKSRSSSTESEPSDMETAIPLALTSDVVERISLPAFNGIISAEEARRAKKRQKRQRRKEKEQQRKALASSIAGGGAEKSAIASTGGIAVAKKIKDRLLDANGN
jgi:hypothetical protein